MCFHWRSHTREFIELSWKYLPETEQQKSEKTIRNWFSIKNGFIIVDVELFVVDIPNAFLIDVVDEKEVLVQTRGEVCCLREGLLRQLDWKVWEAGNFWETLRNEIAALGNLKEAEGESKDLKPKKNSRKGTEKYTKAASCPLIPASSPSNHTSFLSVQPRKNSLSSRPF
jgi:hypothetical protein